MNSYLKIVIFVPGLNIGGIEKVFLNYAALLSDTKNETVLLTCHEKTDLMDIIPEKVKCVNLRTNKLSKSIFKIARFFNEYKPDYILTANAATIAIIIAKYLSFNKVKIIASHHNYINNEIHYFSDRLLLYKAYNLCWKVVAVSFGIKKHLEEFGVRKNKIEVITNPINTEEIDRMIIESTIDLQEPYIVFVGRLSVVKNLSFLLSSFQNVISSFETLKLYIVGDGPEKSNIEDKITELSLTGKVVLTGALDNPYPILNKASVVVLPSLSEAFPTVLLEGLYLGKTIVSTPTNGALEILGTDGWGYVSTSFDNTNEFSDLILRGLVKPINPNNLRKRFEEMFNPQKSLSKLISLMNIIQ
ncbi:glycosyltransferase [uncultured Bacteroides sp.]|uniref:glycosyltransferase n=1 Tax=uncultured Bacteroides sp. TaxID=162156 RepID=UPI0026231C25|nr:glycosyltransferase [uncultured Bacteroides sp.]